MTWYGLVERWRQTFDAVAKAYAPRRSTPIEASCLCNDGLCPGCDAVLARIAELEQALAARETEVATLVAAALGLRFNLIHHCDSMATLDEPDCACGLRARMRVILDVYRAAADRRLGQAGEGDQ